MRPSGLARSGGVALVAALAAACAGVVPPRDAPPEQAISAVLLSSRYVLPSGETRNAELEVGFETGGGSSAEVYRLPIHGGEYYLYLVEPGEYRFAPTRTWMGSYKKDLELVIEGRKYKTAFPRELIRGRTVRVPPRKIVAVGVLEAKVLPALPGQTGPVRVRLDDTLESRRKIVQAMIREMMDPRRPSEARDSSVAWTRALQTTLMELVAEDERPPSYKAAP